MLLSNWQQASKSSCLSKWYFSWSVIVGSRISLQSAHKTYSYIHGLQWLHSTAWICSSAHIKLKIRERGQFPDFQSPAFQPKPWKPDKVLSRWKWSCWVLNAWTSATLTPSNQFSKVLEWPHGCQKHRLARPVQHHHQHYTKHHVQA